MRTVLYINYYRDLNLNRQQELDSALAFNIKNCEIDKIVILGQDKNPDLECNPKIIWHEFDASQRPYNRPTFADYFSVVNRHVGSSEDISIVANADIYFDASLALIKSMDIYGVCLALSRWDKGPDGSFSQHAGDHSQDTWIFQGKIRQLSFADFPMGTWACDNRLAWELWNADYRVINPCVDIRSYHLHSSNIRSPSGTIDAPHAVVHRRTIGDCGLPIRGPIQNGVISFSLWGDIPRYCVGAIQNAKLARHVYPGWVVRFYHDDTVPIQVLEQLKLLNAELVQMPRNEGFSGAFWRFKIADEVLYSHWVVRDCDSRLNFRERRAVDEWMMSTCPFHIMRDHPNHSIIPGCSFGGVRGALMNVSASIDSWEDKSRYGTDEQFTESIIFPLVKDLAMIHDEVTQYRNDSARAFPTRRENGRFCGERCDETEHWNIHDRFILLEAERVGL